MLNFIQQRLALASEHGELKHLMIPRNFGLLLLSGYNNQWRKEGGRHLWQRLVVRSPCHPHSLEAAAEWHRANYRSSRTCLVASFWQAEPSVSCQSLLVDNKRDSVSTRAGGEAESGFWRSSNFPGSRKETHILETDRNQKLSPPIASM